MRIKTEHGGVRHLGQPLLSVAEAGERVGLKHLAIRRAIQRGELEASKLCGRIRVAPEDLDRWVERNSVGGDVAADAPERGP